ncbi:MAG TPA: hypothetical protein PK054_08755 [Anaerohalosphaeraceae bacterium]|nr:hypothetical protein [Anaerohalosphaeraceae bacterium]HPP56657.1 hypothetical protein [Anaerohalosphaeraceae bacterium]
MASLQQSFLNGSLTRLLDPVVVLRARIVEFVSRGDFGLASGEKPDGSYERVWFEESISPDEVAFEQGVFLLLKSKAKALKSMPEPAPKPGSASGSGSEHQPHQPESDQKTEPEPTSSSGAGQQTFRISGSLPPEMWNRLGTKILPKLRSGSDLNIHVEFTVTVENVMVSSFSADLQNIVKDLGLGERISIEPI